MKSGASGGTLYFASPLPYASGFSGFYLPLMIVLWLLILRGIGVYVALASHQLYSETSGRYCSIRSQS
jgi:cytochrome bd-type quinol oxidase subunit 2